MQNNLNPENFTLIACSYNTPILTLTMLKSFAKLHGSGPFKLLLYDNSTNEETATLLTEQKIPFIRNPGGLHGPTVTKALRECKTPYALLVDTDIIFKQNMEHILSGFTQHLNIAAVGKASGPRGGKNIAIRLDPWFCLFNTKLINDNKIMYYRQIVSTDKSPWVIYDIGSSFVLDIKEANLKIVSINDIDKFFTHYEGGSWRLNRYSPSGAIGDIDIDATACHDNRVLYDLGKNQAEEYNKENKDLIESVLPAGIFIV